MHVRDSDKPRKNHVFGNVTLRAGLVSCVHFFSFKRKWPLLVSENTWSPFKNYHSVFDEENHHEAACQLEDEDFVDGWSYHLQPVFGSTRSEPTSVPVNC